ncbi:MAG: hypothetical protein FWC80_07075 [Firmicutes bacterium]|nr:hypothetical protein [Bacillota bacterium]
MNEQNEPDKKEKPELLKIYNIIDWIDFGLIILIVAYIINPDTFGVFPHMGLLLCLISLCLSVSAVIVATLIVKKGINKSKIRLIIRYIIWGIWIPVDLFLIFRMLFNLG